MTRDLEWYRRQYRGGRRAADVAEEVLDRVAAHGDPALLIGGPSTQHLRTRAAELDGLGDAGRTLPLFGVPLVVKDNIDVAGLPTTAACPAFAYDPAEDATVVRLLLDAGAMVVGKANLDQFATGLVGTRSPHGTPRNPVSPHHVPGGSSSGSAAAVAAGLVPVALGTDTAGSGRVPAAMTGVVGTKPTPGLLSTHGVVPACGSLDCVSMFTASVADGRTVRDLLDHPDPRDPWARTGPERELLPTVRGDRLRVAMPDATGLDGVGAELADALTGAAEGLAGLGARIAEASLAPFAATAALLYDGPWLAERLAAVGEFAAANPAALHPITRHVLEGGRGWTAVDVFRAELRRRHLAAAAHELWEHADVLLVPSVPETPTLAEVAADVFGVNARLGRYTNFVNLLAMAAVAVPVGRTSGGAPVGVTVLGPAGADHRVLAVAAALEAAAGGRPAPAAPPVPGTIALAVVGAHLEGQPLNHLLTSRGAQLSRRAATAPAYRLHALPGGAVARPALERVGPGGASLEVEVWALPSSGFGPVVADVTPPLAVGSIELDDGAWVHGFTCELGGLGGATDITSSGGWRAYLASRR